MGCYSAGTTVSMTLSQLKVKIQKIGLS